MASTTQTTYRFKFSNELINKMIDFSQKNKDNFKKLKEFKNSFEEWYNDEELLINKELERLDDMCYVGNIKEKIYNSIRYYYCKKLIKNDMNTVNSIDSTENSSENSCNSVKTNRKCYIQLDKKILNMIDTHIKENIKKDRYTPAFGYKGFVEENYYFVENTYDDMKIRVEKKYNMSEYKKDDFNEKIKKTYKNRYYLISKKYQNDDNISDNGYSSDDSNSNSNNEIDNNTVKSVGSSTIKKMKIKKILTPLKVQD